MSSKVAVLIELFLGLIPFQLIAQSEETEEETEDVIELAAEKDGDTGDYSEIQEELNGFLKKPLNLNTATREQLSGLFFLNPIQIDHILSYRKANGGFMHVAELQVVEGMDPKTIQKMLPYITVGQEPPFRNLLFQPSQKGHHDLIVTAGRFLQNQQGYLTSDTSDKSRYLGSPAHLRIKYKWMMEKRLSFGLTMEKDPGEPFFSGHRNRGFDFYSLNIFYTGTHLVKRLVIGDYNLQVGQGLSMWTGLAFGGGENLLSVARQAVRLKPYSSANENGFLRGAAATLATGKVELTPFVSFCRVDASLNDSGNTSQNDSGIFTLHQTGLHRTPSEIEDRHNISELVGGTDIQYANQSFRVGMLAYRTTFSDKFLPGTALYNQFDFVGSSLTNACVYFNYNWQNLYFFSETAYCLNNGFALLDGIMVSLSPRIAGVFLVRDYKKDYHSFFNHGFAQGSSGTPERGFYSGLQITPDHFTEVVVYADYCRFPWLRYGVDAPSHREELFSQITRKMEIGSVSLRYRVRSKQENNDSLTTVHFPVTVEQQNLRLSLEQKKAAWTLRERVEVAWYKKEEIKETGLVVYQDVFYKPSHSSFSGNIRVALFNTDSYSSGIYAYENNVLYNYSIPVYQNKGWRFYINSKWRISPGIDLSARYAVSSFSNVKTVGSGLDAIQGHVRSEVRFQMRMQF